METYLGQVTGQGVCILSEAAAGTLSVVHVVLSYAASLVEVHGDVAAVVYLTVDSMGASVASVRATAGVRARLPMQLA